VTGRRAEILDGALAVLADHGMRGLTHRAVDAAAGIPAGSTSYYFRSRGALVAGCVERLLEHDLEQDVPEAEAAVPAAGPGDDPPGVLADALTAIGVRMATTERTRTLARYELSLAAVREPALRAALLRGGDTIRHRGAALLARAGATDPDAAAAEVAAVLDGLVYTALVRGPADPAALAAWLRPALHRAVGALPGVAPPRRSAAG
jgi:DNA-binding transcriptional regulator YbjK